MLKKIALATTLFCSSLFSSEFTGNKKLSCEAKICLSNPVGGSISECKPSLDHYFGIDYKSASDTLKARNDFLALCPEKDDENKYNIPTIPTNNSYECSLEELNTNLEEKLVHISGEDAFGIVNEDVLRIRINPKPTKACQSLINDPYATKKPVYACSDNHRWYDKEEEWNKGFATTGVLTISPSQYSNLTSPEKERFVIVEKNGKSFYASFSKRPINKKCWVWGK